MNPLLLALALTTAAHAQVLDRADRVRLAEAFHLAETIAPLPGWCDAPFAVLLVTPEREVLVRHPSPPDGFTLAVPFDSLLGSAVYVRDRQFAPGLLATFPVAGVPTVVVGTAEQTGLRSTDWVLTLIHEHVHQVQMSRPGYFDAVAALDLAGGDTSGMWMLDYPFPYASASVDSAFTAYRAALVRALAAPCAEAARMDVRVARSALRAALSEPDDRYLAFQLWQEGVARYVQILAAEAAVEPLAAFRALPDAEPYAVAAYALRQQVVEELTTLDLEEAGRVVMYPVGAAEALLLDAARPGWRERYLAEPFDLRRYAD